MKTRSKQIRVLLTSLMLITTVPLFAQSVLLPQEAKNPSFRDYSLEQSGFWCSVEGTVASSFIFDRRNLQRAIIAFTCGYRFNEYLRVGVGMGGNCYFNGNKKVRGDYNMFTMPVFLDFRGNILSQEVRELVPYWSLDVGANFGEGFFVSPTIGMRIGQRRNSFLLGLNYTLGEMKTPFRDLYPSNIHYIGLRLGYEF